MSQSQKTPCNFFSKPGGCRKGNRCPYDHTRSTRGGSKASSSGHPSGNVPRAPPGICNFYWSSGSCNRAFNCIFKHEMSPQALRASDSASGSDVASSRSQATDSIAPFLTPAGLSKISGSGADVFRSSSVSLDPQQTQEHLRRFLRDDFRFRTSTAMYPFVGLLSNATSLNNTWSEGDGVLLLDAMASANGRLRLTDVLLHVNVSAHARSDSRKLSFQRGYLPIFQYLSSNFVVKSTLGHFVNALYSLLDINLEHIIENVEKCMEEFMAARSFEEEVIAVGSTSGSVVMGPLLEVFFEYLSRFKNASASHKTLGPFILKVGNWVTAWADDICSPNPTFSDVLTTANSRAFVTNYLKERAQRIVNIVEREQANLDRTAARRFSSMASVASQKDIGHLLNVLAGQYEGPGEVRKDGPRHSNDFVAISDIQVAPTDDELTCKLPPFLPVNIPNAPHPLPSDSMERLFDIQFRLLREELLAPLRTSVQVTLEDMSAPSFRKTQLSEIKKKKGGRYNYQDRHDSVMFNVYTNVEFSKLEMDSRRGMVIEVRMNTPPGSARSDKASTRASYWSNGGGKRLMQGGLVALMWRQHERVEVYLGVVSSTNEKLVEAAKANKERLSVRIQFFDALINFKALEKLRKNDKSNKATDEGLLIESNVVFEAIRPFLESLKREPETIPFRKYLPHPSSSSLSDIHIDPPAYSLVPNFAFELNSLFREGVERNHLRLETSNPDSIATARIELAQRSRLDSSQAEAIIDALTRELALIQGPPGTGKTYMGEELIRVLVENKVKPILLIAFTNHALDHMLTSVIESGITSKVVRLGGRSTDEMIKKYSIEELEKVANRSRLSRSLKSEFRDMKEVEEEIMALLKRFIETNIPSHVLVDSHLSILYPDHIQNLNLAPSWIQQLYHMQSLDSDDSKDAWKAVRMKGKEETRDDSLYSFWKTGKDLDFLHVHREPRRISNEIVGGGDLHNCFSTLLSSQTNDDAADSLSVSSEGADDDVGVESKRQQMIPPVLGSAQNTYSQTPKQIGNAPSFELSDLRQSAVSRLNISDLKDAVEFFELYGEPRIPQVPTSDRSLDDLLDCEDVWSFSASERSRIDAHWVTEFRDFSYRTQKQRFEDLFAKHQDLRERQRNRDEEIRLELMRDSDLIGCTTTGAAKVIAMLKGLGPRVMIVEEAGQVQESHVLASLVDSVNHLILIGDPLQLRPTLNNYGLSMDNPQGGELFKFDMSLMERLSSTGLPMSRLDVQRRMRPIISSLIRDTLYPGLRDHELVSNYPHVRGMDKDVFFFTHSHAEHGGGEDTVSKHNPFEVAMIKDLVKYLLRQGCYSNEGSIVILCAYLGQLAKVRDALKSEMTVVLDERDEVALAEREGDTEAQGEVSVERVDVTQKVKIRSVDNYQGEEADIVILSLVRNSGAGQERNQQDIVGSRTPPKIGFLKSKNRTNVALSRARHGLFILGNATDFASQSKMWSAVVSQLEAQGAVATRIPIKCNRHPHDVRYISEPGELLIASPDGGCLLNCNERLACGHNCPYKCHSDDEHHRNVFCMQACPKLCSRGHPCTKQCAYKCGKCTHPILNVKLPCGHVHESVPCYRLDDLSEVSCIVKVQRGLPSCEHTVVLPCNADVRQYKCKARCDGMLTCCGKSCKSKCHECQQDSENLAAPRRAPRIRHKAHECLKPLYCEHMCSGKCSADHACLNECKEQCRQACAHAQCRLPCSKPCAPCQEPCMWNCPHYTCPVPCGSVCARIPCDLRCQMILSCGHQCPSVCGENCDDQICLECSPKDKLNSIADFIMQRSLQELEPSQGTLDELIITLPGCHHSFTVETLDGHCHMEDYYEKDEQDKWLKLKSPATGYKQPPTCPTCRRAIRSPRYGRVYKRADLDILERNTATAMTRSLNSAKTEFNAFDRISAREKLASETWPSPASEFSFSQEALKASTKERKRVLSSTQDFPVEWNVLDPGKPLHGIWNVASKHWLRHIEPMRSAYQQARNVALTRSAHMKAWESAFSSFYRQEIEAAVQDPLNAPYDIQDRAMQAAKRNVGQSKPLADKRFCVEAIWLTLDIRFLLVDLAQGWLRGQSKGGRSPEHSKLWSIYIAFILATCERDAGVALRIAEESDSQRQMLSSRILVLNSGLETFKFNLRVSQDAGLSKEDRESLIERIKVKIEDTKNSITEEVKRRRGNKQVPREQFENLFKNPAGAILEEWKELESSLCNNAIYSPISYEEKKQVVGALMSNWDFTHSGHFYTCPNGHTFVISECGGAMETARCPECFETIGGTGHNLVSSNRRDFEFEAIAREQGAQESPWAWGR